MAAIAWARAFQAVGLVVEGRPASLVMAVIAQALGVHWPSPQMASPSGMSGVSWKSLLPNSMVGGGPSRGAAQTAPAIMHRMPPMAVVLLTRCNSRIPVACRGGRCPRPTGLIRGSQGRKWVCTESMSLSLPHGDASAGCP